MSEGVIYDIQRYCIHDGPGIRSTVFFKGCPLDCWWCHNPESKAFGPEIVFWPDKCIDCGWCTEACPHGTPPGEASGAGACELCGSCSAACPSGAVQLIGETVTVQHVAKEVSRDTVFYDESDGGVTFSGGEPLGQPEFLLDLLRECRSRRIHTAVDTSGHADWCVVKEVAGAADLLLWDLKHIDARLHAEYAGLSNDIILDNLQRLVGRGFSDRIVARFPLIPTINDDEEQLQSMGELLSCLKIKRLNILPYHPTARGKYARLHDDYRLAGLSPPDDKQVEAVQRVFGEYDICAEIGG